MSLSAEELAEIEERATYGYIDTAVTMSAVGTCRDDVPRVVAELRAARAENEKLRGALKPFAITPSEIGRFNLRCDGSVHTGYRCGVDGDGRAIYGFDSWCKWCAARKALGMGLAVNLMPDEFRALSTAAVGLEEETAGA